MSENNGTIILRQIQEDDCTKKFSLGNQAYTPLKIFLQKKAFEYHRYDAAKTYVIVDTSKSPAEVKGYITLMCSEIGLKGDNKPTKPLDMRHHSYPSVKITQLAIDKSFRGKGFGLATIDWCVGFVKDTIMPNVGCRFLTVDSKPESVDFYKKAGFTLVELDSKPNSPHLLMYYDLNKENKSESLKDIQQIEQNVTENEKFIQ